MRPPALLARRSALPSPVRGLGVVVLLLAVLVMPACTDEPEEVGTLEASPAAAADLATPPTLQPDDLVDLTVYFRAGEGSTGRLKPVVKEVPVDDDLPRRALELLLAGPSGEEETLTAPLPTSTEVLGLSVEGGTAQVELSDAVLEDAGSVGASPANEALALAALANTLTEFTSIDRVVLTVAGEDPEVVEEFWGGWGLPDVLVRDESLLHEAESEGLVDLGRFSGQIQTAGAPGTPPVRVTSVRVRDRITHTRFVLELADAIDPDAPAKVPPVRVRRMHGGMALELSDAAALDVEDAEVLELDPEQFTEARSELDEASGTLQLVVTPTEPRPYWLHTLSNPTRVVLDVKK